MKGIKTAVKTDWKNYASGNSRGPIDITKSSVYFHGFAKGDTVYLSYHVRWKGVDWGTWTEKGCFQGNSHLAYIGVGPDNKGLSEGEQYVKACVYIDNPSWAGVTETTEKDLLSFFTHVRDGGIKVADDGYIEVTDLMVSKGSFLPYIDSDELKAEGVGTISRALIVALHLNAERRVA